ncbi:MAG: zinc ribbon domain-containing protein [Lachnospiraceae bacterium]|nr:zinc ribbon domain-containing protein [Lachnospiraceae bacterium]
MKCSNCGADIPEGGMFCVNCGAKAEEAQQTPQQPVQNDIPGPVSADYSVATSKPKSGINIGRIVVIAAVVLVLCLAVLLFFKLKKTKVNLNEYLEVTTSGYDGYGSVEVTFDSDKFIKDYRGKIKPNKNLKHMIKEYDELEVIMKRGDYNVKKDKDVCGLFADVFTSAAEVDLENTDGDKSLKNGDVVIYKWNLDSDALPLEDAIAFAKDAFNVKLDADDYEITIDGLEKIDTFDPFEGVEVEYTGVSPNASAQITSRPNNNGLDYYIKENGGFKNGDSVTITAQYSYYSPEEYVAQFNKMPETLEKTMTVEGVDEYITDVSQITASDLDAMKKQCEDKIRAQAANSWNKEVSVGALDYDSAYLLTAKDTSNSYDINKIVIVYKVTANFSFENSDYNTSYQYYYYVTYTNAIRVKDGSLLVDLNSYETPSNSTSVKMQYGPRNYDYSNYYFYGYETFDSLFSDAVTRKIEKFDYIQIP